MLVLGRVEVFLNSTIKFFPMLCEYSFYIISCDFLRIVFKFYGVISRPIRKGKLAEVWLQKLTLTQWKSTKALARYIMRSYSSNTYYVVVNFYFRLNFSFPLFLCMLMQGNVHKYKGKLIFN